VLVGDPIDTPTKAPTPLDPLSAARTVQAEVVLTREAGATSTPTRTPTASPTATATATVDGTAQFLTTCTTDVELVKAVRGGRNSNFVPVDTAFTFEWTLRNSGTCPWPDDLVWAYVDGDDLDGQTVALDTAVAPGDEVTLKASFPAIANALTYESSWQLQDNNGRSFGPPLTFEVAGFVPQTATPIPPTPTVTSAAPAAADGKLTWIWTVKTCDYPNNGPNWRCLLEIVPYLDGTTTVGKYTVYIFDQAGGQATVFRGTGPHTYVAIYGRCRIFNTNARITDDLTGQDVNRVLSIDPNIYFPGGCTEN
jgi:hypothetical protein